MTEQLCHYSANIFYHHFFQHVSISIRETYFHNLNLSNFIVNAAARAKKILLKESHALAVFPSIIYVTMIKYKNKPSSSYYFLSVSSSVSPPVVASSCWTFNLFDVKKMFPSQFCEIHVFWYVWQTTSTKTWVFFNCCVSVVNFFLFQFVKFYG